VILLYRRAGTQRYDENSETIGDADTCRDRKHGTVRLFESRAAMMEHTMTETRLALLGTLGPLHTTPLRYDLACLRTLVEALEPDLLGVEADPVAWAQGDLRQAPVEVAAALAPAARRTDTVLVPLGGPLPGELAPPDEPGLRARFIRGADRLLAWLQRTADSPERVNSALFGYVCGTLCHLEEAAASAAGRQAWEQANRQILERLLQMVRRDPGGRVLVAVSCRRVHWLIARLQPLQPEIRLVPYAEL
jgi:hypothetical protein